MEWQGTDTFALVVAGAPGTGKTALAEALAAGHCGLPEGCFTTHAVHHCRQHVCASTDPIRALANIAGQLTHSVPGYQVLTGRHGRSSAGTDGDPAQLAVRSVLDSATASAAFDNALSLPFERLTARRGRPRWSGRGGDAVVVFDGLDEEVPGASTAGLADLLADRLTTPVPGLRLLLTSRPGPVLDRLSPRAVFDLSADCPSGVDDVHEYLDATGSLPARSRAAAAAAAAGCYLYADVLMRLLAAGAGRLTVDDLPSGIGELYDRALGDVGEAGSLSRLVLSVLARSRDDGLTVDHVAGLLHADPADVAVALHRSRHLLTGFRRLRPHHRCLSESLWAETPDPAALDWLIACHLRESEQADPRARGGGPYSRRNLWAHLADVAAGGDLTPARQTLSASTADARYVTSALLDVGVDDLLSTLSYAERRMRLPNKDVASLSKVLRRQAAALRRAHDQRDEPLLVQQLVYEAATMGMPSLARCFAERLPDTGILTLWATSDNRMRHLPAATAGHAGQVTNVVVTADGTRGFTTSKDRVTRIWRLASGKLVQALRSNTIVSNMYAARDTPHVVTSTNDGGAQIWDADLAAPVAELTGRPTWRVTAFATNDTGTVGVGGDMDGHATVWDLTVGEPLMRLPCPAGLITAVAITSDATMVATASMTGAVTIWELATGAPVARLPGNITANALAISPDGDCLLIGGDGLGAYALSDDDSPRLLARLVTTYLVTAVAINPAMPAYALFGGAFGQVGYVRLPVGSGSTDMA